MWSFFQLLRYLRRSLEGRHCVIDDRDGYLKRTVAGDGVLEAGPASALAAGVEDRLPDGKVRRVLNVGGNSHDISIPSIYDGWESVMLDIDPACNPDVLCDARELGTLIEGNYDSVYCSHNLEHYHHHDVARVLAGFCHVLKDDGFVYIRVPDIAWLMREVAEKDLDIGDVLYQSASGPITVRDVVYGYGDEIERSGNDYFAHKTGFSKSTLISALQAAGFQWVFANCSNIEIAAMGFKQAPTRLVAALLNLPISRDGIKAGGAAAGIDPQQHLAENRQQDSQDDGARDSILLKTADGISVSVPATLRCISTLVLLEQEKWFERELGFLLRWLEPGMNAVDVGANVGFYCLPVARAVGESGMVVAFEPGSGNRSHLEASRAANALANLTISACALADAKKDGWLSIAESGELNRLSEEALRSANAERVGVSTLDLQDQESAWPPIDFVKIDAEGQEARIVAGGRVFFARQSPLVMYEIKDAGASNDVLRWMFEALGYRTYRLLGDSSCLVPMTSDETLDPYELNLFAAKPDRAALLAAKGLLVLAPEQVLLNDAERSRALAAMLDQPFAQAFEFSEGDVLDCAYGEAVILYAASRFIDLSPARRLAALEAALEILVTCCRSSPTPTGLATMVRVALDLGRRSAAVDALRQLVSASGVELDQPFFPPCARFEALSPESREADWFSAAVYEQLEMSEHHSSWFAASDSTRLKWLCESPFASPEISRRMILRAAGEGMASSALANFLRAEHRHANPAYWTAGGISLLQALL